MRVQFELRSALTMCLCLGLVFSGCEPEPGNGPDPLDDVGTMSADVGSDTEDMDPSQAPEDGGLLGVCDPDPYEPERPLWSQIQNPNNYDTGAYPDYRDISNNFTVLDSLTLMISIFTKSIERLENLKSADLGAGLAGYLDPQQAFGHCICNDCGNLAPEDVWSSAQAGVFELAQNANANLPSTFATMLNEILQTRIDFLRGEFQSFESFVIAQPQTITDNIQNAVNAEVQALLNSAQNTISSIDPNANGISTLLMDYQMQIADAQAGLQAQIQMDFNTVQSAVNALLDLENSPSVTALWTDVKALWDIFKNVNEIDDLTCPDGHASEQCVDFESAAALIGNIQDEVTSIVATVQGAVDAVLSTYNAVNQSVTLATNMAQALGDDLEQTFAQAIQGTAVSLIDLENDVLNFEANLVAAIQGELQNGLDATLAEIQDLADDCQQVVSGAGIGQDLQDVALNQLNAQLIDPFLEIINESLGGCYARARRAGCNQYCADNGDVFLWFPIDVFKDPNQAGAVALFALDQVGFLDEITQLTANNDSPFLDAVSGAIGALGDAATTLANIQDVLASFLDYLDHYTEGYHLGAYDTQRPDLHMCVGYAGHGAYAQMGGLGNDKVSIGARYSAHNLSKKHRVQFRSGGFAVQAWGRGLSLAPAIELNTQMDGWRWWSAEAPFGLPASGMINTSDIIDYDVFHLVDDDQLGALASNNGQIGFGNLLVKDLYSAQYDNGMSGPHEWPRPDARDEVPWERYSAAVLSAGLNLKLELTPQEWLLPTIDIWPPFLSATPYFGLGAGVQWRHETNYQLTTLRDKINEGLSSVDQLEDADFNREMHDFQAPDLSADNGTSAYVEPEVGLKVFLGFKIWKIRIGAGADLGLSIRIEPAGYGGVLDLNAALADLLTQSNPSADAPCEPVMDTTYNKVCNNVEFLDPDGQPLSDRQLACEPSSSGSSCCLLIGGLRACIDEWTGIDEALCNSINTPHETRQEAVAFIEGLPTIIPSGIINPILNVLNDPNVVNFNLMSTWNVGTPCARSCPDAEYSTALVNLTSLSECQQYGRCVRPDGTIEYDVTEADCIGEQGSSCRAVLPPENAPIGTLVIGADSESAQYTLGSQGMWTQEWQDFVMSQASAAAAAMSSEEKCNNEGYCLNFTYMATPDSAAAGYVSQGEWSIGDFASYPIGYVGLSPTPDGCSRGRDEQGNYLAPISPGQDGIQSTPSLFVPFLWQPPEPPGQWTGYACSTDINETLVGWTGPGCSPLQHGFSSACGCETDAQCVAGERCENGRCVGEDGGDLSCVCAEGGICPNGRVCHQGACVSPCVNQDECASGRICDNGLCIPPEGVPFAETIAYGMANVSAPIHLITSYAMSTITFLARFNFAAYVEASFKLFGRKKTWRLFDFARVWDIGSTSKAWYQPGLEARYQHQCAEDVAGAGMTNRFPISPTTPAENLTADGASLHPSCAFLSGGVCRYPGNPSDAWNDLPPVVQDPDEFVSGNAGNLEDFLAWCKDDMPTQTQNPDSTTPEDITESVVETIEFGHDVGMEIWVNQQMCINGKTWRQFYSDLPNDFDSFECTYIDPSDGETYLFPCTEVTDNMLRIWGCLDVNANLFSQSLAEDFPQLVVNDPEHGSVINIDAMFNPQWLPTEQPDGSVIPQLDLVYDSYAMQAEYRNQMHVTPFISLLGHRWLASVNACFDQRFEDPAETECPCMADVDCTQGDGDQCIDGLCHRAQLLDPLCDENCQTEYVRRECTIVSMNLDVGPCCGDGEVQDDPALPYSEECDDGNTESGDGCSATCEKEDGAPPDCEAFGDQCRDRCPQGLVCDANCRACIPDDPPECAFGSADQCVDNCPDGQQCDAGCSTCVDEPNQACSMAAGGRCMDTCPNGQQCDADCNACVDEPEVECALGRDGQCMDNCPGGFQCDRNCAVCVEVAVPPCRTDAADECIDLCPLGFACNAQCDRCVRDAQNCRGPDLCDGLDNDCDRRLDEDFQAEDIVCGLGVCQREGVTACRAGNPVSICDTGAPESELDRCDGRDNDCDGRLDEDCERRD